MPLDVLTYQEPTSVNHTGVLNLMMKRDTGADLCGLDCVEKIEVYSNFLIELCYTQRIPCLPRWGKVM